MSAKSLSEEKRSLYKYYAGVIMGPVKTIESFNYVLPSSCMFPLPSVTQANIHSFSVGAGKEVTRRYPYCCTFFTPCRAMHSK